MNGILQIRNPLSWVPPDSGHVVKTGALLFEALLGLVCTCVSRRREHNMGKGEGEILLSAHSRQAENTTTTTAAAPQLDMFIHGHPVGDP